MNRTTNVPSFEALETRSLMSGNVLASVAPATGNLTIKYDPAITGDIEIQVTKAGTNVTVVPGGTTTINGSGSSVLLAGVAGTVTITMGGGSDSVQVGEDDGSQFIVAAPGTIPHYKNFVVNMGAGNDNFTAYGLLAANVSIVNGTGDNTTVLDGGSSDGGSVIAGTLTITGGGDVDQVSIIGYVVVTKACTINNAAGDNETIFNDDGTNTPAFAKTLAITGGVNLDTVTVDVSGAGDGLFVAGAVTLTLGAGETNVFNVDMMTAGSLTFIGGTGDDLINPDGTSDSDFLDIRKGLTLTMGAGDNEVNLNDVGTRGGNLAYTGSATSDDIDIAGDAEIHGSVTLNVGTGVNDVDIVYLSVSGALTYTGGLGSDTFTIDDAIDVAGASTFTMGDGENTLDVNSATFDNLTYGGGANTDHVWLSDTHVLGITKITTLAAADDVMISAGSDFMGTFTLDMGAGMDTVDIASEAGAGLDSTNFLDAVSILGGTENDTVTIGAARTSGEAVHFYDLLTKFDGGAGLDDSLTRTDVLYSFIPTVIGFETNNII
jgi:serralysin